MMDGDNIADTVFDANNTALFADPVFAKDAMAAQVVEYPDIDVAGLFVLGVVFGFLEGRPTLPTPAYERALICLLGFFCRGGSSLDDARVRTNKIDRKYNSADALCDRIIAYGREAHSTGGDRYLIASHKAAMMVATSKRL